MWSVNPRLTFFEHPCRQAPCSDVEPEYYEASINSCIPREGGQISRIYGCCVSRPPSEDNALISAHDAREPGNVASGLLWRTPTGWRRLSKAGVPPLEALKLPLRFRSRRSRRASLKAKMTRYHRMHSALAWTPHSPRCWCMVDNNVAVWRSGKAQHSVRYGCVTAR